MSTPFGQTLDSTAAVDLLKKMKNPRLYIALYAIDGPLRPCNPIHSQDYYWTFTIFPAHATTKDPGIRYRIRQEEGLLYTSPATTLQLDMAVWEPDRRTVPLGRHDEIVARVLIAKVDDRKRLDQYLASVMPEKTIHVKPSGHRKTSKEWVERAHARLGELAQGSLRFYISGRLADWRTVEGCCVGFAERVRKRPESESVPTFDLLEGREVF